MKRYFEKSFEFWVAGTRGGPTRARIIQRLIQGEKNCHAISKELELDYSTVEHHLEKLKKEGIVSSDEEKQYGKRYRLTFNAEQLNVVKRILEELGKTS